MKYFLHDTSSFDDEKITELFLRFGYEGLGLFYTTLEKIGKQEKPVKTDVLKAQLRVGKRLNKCWSFMEEIGLISSNNGETFNEQLLNFSEKYQIKKEKTKEKVLQWRERQKDKKNVTGYVPECNHSKVKESKEKDIKEKQELFKAEVESFTETYPIEMLTAFYVYWSEPNKTKSKMKKELEKTWDTARRLVTWKNNQESWKRR